MLRKSFLYIIIWVFTSIICNCNIIIASTNTEDVDDTDKYNYNYAVLTKKCPIYDPYESINRKVFFFNSTLDFFLLRPIAKIYGALVPDQIKNSIGSATQNIQEPLSTVNYTLQGDGRNALKSFWRFVINSTFGIAGLFDVASKFDLKTQKQNFSHTLAYYGVGPGPYIVLPLHAGMSMRDIPNIYPIELNNRLNPFKEYVLNHKMRSIAARASQVHARYSIIPFTQYIAKLSTDPYIAVRNAQLQNKESEVNYTTNFICPTVLLSQ